MSEAVIQRLKISREGVILIKSFEGFRPRAIRRDDGQWVIGYGHTLSAREGATVSEADAELLLQYDLIPVAKAVNEGVSATVNQHQFDALASFAFSVGVDRFQSSDVLSRLNAGFAGEAADAMIGWPEPVVAETALRRRAAERALFVANPGAPVALADLLSAPLPPPYRGPVEPPVPTPVAPVEAEVPAEYLAPDLAQDAVQEPEQEPDQNARHAAVAALLSDPAPVLHQPEAEAEAEADIAHIEAPALEAPAVEAPAAEAAVEPAEAEAAPETVEVAPEEPAPAPPPSTFTANLSMQRYSAYAGSIIGPLPGAIRSPMVNAFQAPEKAEAPEAAPAPAPAEPVAAESDPVAPSLTETAPREIASPEAIVETGIEAEVETSAETGAEAGVDTPSAEPTPVAAPWYVGEAPGAEVAPAAPFASAPVAASPFPEPAAPAGSAPVEAAPVEASAEAVVEAQPNPFALVAPPADVTAQPSAFDTAPPQPALEIPVFGAAPPFPPSPWPAAISATSEPRTDGELLVLNGAPESEVFAAPRLVWPHSEQSGDDAPALFEDDGSLRLAPGNILRHEVVEETPPARLPWGELAAYGVMGGFGLVSFGMSMAAFRRAADDNNGGDGVILIAVVLAVVGAACVGVSAYNLYRRWGRTEEE